MQIQTSCNIRQVFFSHQGKCSSISVSINEIRQKNPKQFLKAYEIANLSIYILSIFVDYLRLQYKEKILNRDFTIHISSLNFGYRYILYVAVVIKVVSFVDVLYIAWRYFKLNAGSFEIPQMTLYIRETSGVARDKIFVAWGRGWGDSSLED